MDRNLIIDIGNSNIKITLASDSESLYRNKRYSYDKAKFSKELDKVFSDYKKSLPAKIAIKKAGVSSTHPGVNKIISRSVKKYYGINPLFINPDSKLPIKIKYKSRLGSDRICSASSAYMRYKKKYILVIDFGTATTYNFINNGIFIGGMISPGIVTSMNALIGKTYLPGVKLDSNVNIISNDTRGNIKSGVVLQTLFTTERVITGLKKKHKSLYVIATGGLSGLIYSQTKLINEMDKNLVAKGINIILKS